MKKITTDRGTFGPFEVVQELGDHFIADGIQYPFTVIGSGTVDEWTDPIPVNTPVEVVPYDISPRQLRQALTYFGFRANVEAAISASNQDIKDWWEFSTAFERNHPVVNMMLDSLGFSQDQANSVWIYGATL